MSELTYNPAELLGNLPSFEITNTGATIYNHPAGEYNVMIGPLVVYYKDVEGKTKNADGTKVTKDTPGAKPAFANLTLFNLAEGDTNIISINPVTNDIDCAPVDYGRFTHRLYVGFDSDKLFQNKSLFEDFNAPQLEVIVDPKSADFKFRPAYVDVYMGIPAKLTLKEYTSKNTGKTSVIVASLKLLDKTFSKDLVDKRKSLAYKVKNKVESLKPEKKDDAEAEVVMADASDALKNIPF